MENHTYLVSTTSCSLICANILSSFDEIVLQTIKLVLAQPNQKTAKVVCVANMSTYLS